MSSASQPDWYMGWLDGALRIMPGWEVRAFGFEIPNPFFPGVLLAGLTFGLLYAWPFLEARVTGDYAAHHINDRPRTRPVRTALGMATLTFYGVLFLGGAADVLAATFTVSVNSVLWTFRFAFFLAPPVTAWVTYRLCKELSLRDGVETASKVRIRDIPHRLRRGPPGHRPRGSRDSAHELVVDPDGPVGPFRPPVAGEQHPARTVCGPGHEGVVDGPADDAQVGKRGEQGGPVIGVEPAAVRKRLGQHRPCLRPRQPERHGQAREHGVRLEGRVPGERRPPLDQRSPARAVGRVGGVERGDGDARVARPAVSVRAHRAGCGRRRR